MGLLLLFIGSKRGSARVLRQETREGRNFIIELNDYGRVICVPAINKIAATMKSIEGVQAIKGRYSKVSHEV